MKNAKGMTFSADRTGHQSINYNSHHVHLLVENYASKSSDNNTKQQAIHTFGIQSSLDGSSEMAVADWENTLSVHHGFVNLRGYPGMGKAGTGTGHLVVTRRKPTPVPRVWRVFLMALFQSP